MAKRSTPVLTRSLKRLETQERLKGIVDVPTPSPHRSLATLSSPATKISRTSGSTFELREQLQSTVWVQCDTPSCYKWRSVTKAELEDVTGDTKWFCSMNRNPDFASCQIAEENTEWYDKAARRVGLCYVKTPIPEGSLVWAKLTGYCTWPGVITKDPADHVHCLLDMDRQPAMYHVEFLGGAHTHSWIQAHSVKLYTPRTVSPQLKSRALKWRKGRRVLKRQGRKRAPLTVYPEKLYRKFYKKGVSVDEAYIEANRLLTLSIDERLAKCNFLANDGEMLEVAMHAQTFEVNNSEEQQEEPQDKRTKSSVKQKMRRAQNHTKSNVEQEKCDAYSFDLSEHSSGEADQSRIDNLEMKFPDSLVSHSKEEKLVLDVQMYQRNERAFEHDVLRFMKRNGVKFHGLPKWQNTFISLFQLFLAVHERGGYDMVCSKRGSWVQVYKELTECQNSGDVAKKYYKRNLYPYELYIKGKDFKKTLPHARKKKEKSERKSSLCKQPVSADLGIQHTVGDTVCNTSADQWQSFSDVLVDQDSLLSSEQSGDLMEMLADLENCGNFCSLEDDILMSKRKLGIDITFFDESPRRQGKDLQYIKEANTVAEFGCTILPLFTVEHAQEVPAGSLLSSQSCLEEQIFHEMKALQDGINLVAVELNIL